MWLAALLHRPPPRGRTIGPWDRGRGFDLFYPFHLALPPHPPGRAAASRSSGRHGSRPPATRHSASASWARGLRARGERGVLTLPYSGGRTEVAPKILAPLKMDSKPNIPGPHTPKLDAGSSVHTKGMQTFYAATSAGMKGYVGQIPMGRGGWA